MLMNTTTATVQCSIIWVDGYGSRTRLSLYLSGQYACLACEATSISVDVTEVVHGTAASLDWAEIVPSDTHYSPRRHYSR